MPAIIFLLPVIVIVFALIKRPTPGWLFLNIYLPALLLVPDTFHTVTIGIPKLSVNQAIILAIFPFAFIQYAKLWRPSVTDMAAILLVALMSVSEYLAAGYKEAQNLCVGLIASGLAPYFVARWCIAFEQLHVATARRIVILMFAVVILSLFEFKFGYNPFLAWFGKLFPGQGTGWVTTFRYGFARVAGPYSHAILAGIMIAVAYRLQRWLEWGQYWERSFQHLPALPLSKARLISWALLLGCVMTFARGPWLGGILGALLLIIGRSQHRQKSLYIIAGVMLVTVPGAYMAFDAYLEVAPGVKMTMSQESAMYRKVLMSKYMDIAIDHAYLGWGRNTWPKVPGMASIDNYFLLLSLMHGLLATLTFLFLFVWQTIRLFLHGMREPVRQRNFPDSMSLAFTHAGILLMIVVSLVTVYLGEQVVPMLFLIFGWSEVVLQYPQAPQQSPASEHGDTTPFEKGHFRVMR